MLFNPKTTVIGVLLLVGAVSRLVVAALASGEVPADAWRDLLTALAGLGLIQASDGRP